MFVVEYRTVSRLGLIYPTRVLTLGMHKATNLGEAETYVARCLGPNVEIVSARYQPIA